MMRPFIMAGPSHALLSILVVLAAGIFVSGYSSYRSYEREYGAQVSRQLSAIAELKVRQLVEYRRERLEDAAVLFKNASLSSLARRWLEKPEDADAQRQLCAWLDKYPAHHQYDRVFLLDARGVTRMSTPKAPQPIAGMVSQRAPEIMRSGQVAFQDFYRNEHDQRVYLAVLVPILDEQGAKGPGPLGVLVMQMDPAAYLYPLVQHWPAPSSTAEALLVRRDGNDVLYLSKLRSQTGAALNLRTSLKDSQRLAVTAVLGHEGIMEGLDYRGTPVIGVTRAIPESPWFLVAHMNASEVYQPLRDRAWLMAGLVSALLLGATLGVGLLWRQQSTRFYREKARITADKLRESENALSITLQCMEERKRTEEQRARTLRREQGISLLQRSLLTAISREDKLKAITDAVVELFDADFCRIWVIRPGDLCERGCVYAGGQEGLHVCGHRDHCLHLLASSGRYTHVDGQEHRRIPFGCHEIGRIASGEPENYLTNDVQNDPMVHHHAWARELGLVSLAGYRIRVPDGKNMGVLALFAGHPISSEDHAMLDGLGSTVARVLQQATAEESLWQSKADLERTNAQLEQAIGRANRMAAQAEGANRVKGEFLANMSHELRTPMNAIIGFTEMMIHDTKDPPNEKRARRLEKVYRNSRNLLALINDILDISKIEADRLTLDREDVDVADMITECIESIRPLVAEGRVELRSELAPSLGDRAWVGDAGRLRQIIINLLSNAGKFTEAGYIEVRAEAKNGFLHLAVEDSGIGIPPEQLSAVFDEFVQVDSSSARKASGTGLGLSICRKLCNLMQGQISVTSTPGVGCCFTVSLPMSVDRGLATETGQASPPEEVVLYAGSTSTVASIRQVMTRGTSRPAGGLDVTYATEVRDAVAMCQRIAPATVWVDPFWDDALRLVTDLKTHCATSGLTIGFLGLRDDRCAFFRLDDFITAPCSANTLHRVIWGDGRFPTCRVLQFGEAWSANNYVLDMLAEFADVFLTRSTSVEEALRLVSSERLENILFPLADPRPLAIELGRRLREGATSALPRMIAVIPREPRHADGVALRTAFRVYLETHGDGVEETVGQLSASVASPCPSDIHVEAATPRADSSRRIPAQQETRCRRPLSKRRPQGTV